MVLSQGCSAWYRSRVVQHGMRHMSCPVLVLSLQLAKRQMLLLLLLQDIFFGTGNLADLLPDIEAEQYYDEQQQLDEGTLSEDLDNAAAGRRSGSLAGELEAAVIELAITTQAT